MLTCFQGPTNIVFQKILKFFVKQNSVVLDITYGRGLSWKDLKENYTITKIDKRKLFGDTIKTDFNDYLRMAETDSLDCIYFDPPYYFKEKISDFNIKGQMLNDEDEVFWTEEEFKHALITLQTEAPRVLKKEGIFISKIMDGYIGKRYYPLAFDIFNTISIKMESKGIFICPVNKTDKISELIRTNQIYYLVFQNKKSS